MRSIYSDQSNRSDTQLLINIQIRKDCVQIVTSTLMKEFAGCLHWHLHILVAPFSTSPKIDFGGTFNFQKNIGGT